MILPYRRRLMILLGFVLTAEIKRLQANQDSVQIVILPGPVGGFRSDNLWPRSNTKRKELLQSIVLPMCKLLPSCTAAELATDRNTRLSEPVIGRGARLYGMDKLVNALTNSRPLRPKVEPIKNDRLVTITLRECEHWPERNSNLSEWANAARAIRDMGYEIQFIRDTTHADESIDDFWINFEAARDLLVRASLYRSTFCNFFVNNGPAWLAFALNAPMVMLKPNTEKLGRCYSANYLNSCGIPRGGQMPGSGTHQRIIWKEDTSTNILEAFNDFRSS